MLLLFQWYDFGALYLWSLTSINPLFCRIKLSFYLLFENNCQRTFTNQNFLESGARYFFCMNQRHLMHLWAALQCRWAFSWNLFIWPSFDFHVYPYFFSYLALPGSQLSRSVWQIVLLSNQSFHARTWQLQAYLCTLAPAHCIKLLFLWTASTEVDILHSQPL